MKVLKAGLGVAVMAAAVLAADASAAQAGDEVNVYSSRKPFLINPVLDAFTAKTGIKVNVVYAKKGMLQRLQAEGRNSPADMILTADIGRLHDHAKAGLLQPVASKALEANIPPQYRHPDGLWYGLTLRARVVYAHKDRVKTGELVSYADLAKPHMKGRVCTRSGKHVYNVSLLAAFVTHDGNASAKSWAEGVKANLARRPQGNDRAQVKAIKEGECDVSIGNSYYMGLMQTNTKAPEQKAWANAVRVVFPDQGGRGTHVNVSGGAITASSKNREAAVKLLEFLSGDEAQKIYAERNFEYPVKPGVALHPVVAAWGAFKADTVNLAQVATNRATASRVMDKVKFDQ